ncbi:hypothetical protein O6P43_016978, partial [Quillaja saponaria]
NKLQHWPAMVKRGPLTISMFSNSTMLVGWYRPRRRFRRRRGSNIRLGNKRRQVLSWITSVGAMGCYDWSPEDVEEVHHGDCTKWEVNRGLLLVIFISTTPAISLVLRTNSLFFWFLPTFLSF